MHCFYEIFHGKLKLDPVLKSTMLKCQQRKIPLTVGAIFLAAPISRHKKCRGTDEEALRDVRFIELTQEESCDHF